jgi:hypothetical protein
VPSAKIILSKYSLEKRGLDEIGATGIGFSRKSIGHIAPFGEGNMPKNRRKYNGRSV